MYNFTFYRPVKIETILKNPNFVLEMDAGPNNTREGWAFLRYLPNEVHEDNKPYGFYIRCEHIEPTMNSYLQYGEANSDGHPFQALEALYMIFGVLWTDFPEEVVYVGDYVKNNEWDDFIYGLCAYYMVNALGLNESDDMYQSLKPLMSKYDDIGKQIAIRTKQLRYKIKIWLKHLLIILRHPMFIYWDICNRIERKKWDKEKINNPEN